MSSSSPRVCARCATTVIARATSLGSARRAASGGEPADPPGVARRRRAERRYRFRTPADLAVERVAGRLPKPCRDLVVEGDERGHAARPAQAQAVLSGPDQREADPLSPVLVADGEPVHVPAPSVPGGDQGADDLPLSLGHEENGGRLRCQTLDVVDAVGRARVPAAGVCPQLQDGRRLGLPAPPHLEAPASQARSLCLPFGRQAGLRFGPWP